MHAFFSPIHRQRCLYHISLHYNLFFLEAKSSCISMHSKIKQRPQDRRKGKMFFFKFYFWVYNVYKTYISQLLYRSQLTKKKAYWIFSQIELPQKKQIFCQQPSTLDVLCFDNRQKKNATRRSQCDPPSSSPIINLPRLARYIYIYTRRIFIFIQGIYIFSP